MPRNQTAYGKLKERERAEKKRKPNRGARAGAATRGKCGAKKRHGKGICGLPKGYGTEHLGFGRCRFHGGNAPNGRKSAAKDQAVLMGAPIDMNPLDALIWCIKITAGEIEFCTKQLEILDQDEWLEHTLIGKQIHVWAKERQKAVDRLAKMSKDALGLGIAERAVRLAEQYGSSLAKYTKGLLEDLELTPDQMKKAPLVVRKHLALLEGGSPVTDADRRNLPAIPQRVA